MACFCAHLLDQFLLIMYDVQWLAKHIIHIEIGRSGIMWGQREKIPAFKNDWVAQIRSDHTLKMDKRSKSSPLSYLHQGESHSNVPSWKLILQLSSTGNVLAFASQILADRRNGESSCLWLRNTPIVLQTTNICCCDIPNLQVFFDFPCPWYHSKFIAHFPLDPEFTVTWHGHLKFAIGDSPYRVHSQYVLSHTAPPKPEFHFFLRHG